MLGRVTVALGLHMENPVLVYIVATATSIFVGIAIYNNDSLRSIRVVKNILS